MQYKLDYSVGATFYDFEFTLNTVIGMYMKLIAVSVQMNTTSLGWKGKIFLLLVLSCVCMS